MAITRTIQVHTKDEMLRVGRILGVMAVKRLRDERKKKRKKKLIEFLQNETDFPIRMRDVAKIFNVNTATIRRYLSDNIQFCIGEGFIYKM